jgi:ankyrin repeat protein
MGGTDSPPVSVDGFRACESDDVANEYIRRHPDVLILQDTNGFTPLHVAAEKGWTASVETILQKKPNLLNDNLNSKEQTPLHVAILNKKYDVALELLRTTDVNVNLRDSEGQTPLHLAARSSNPSVVDALLERQDLDDDDIFLNDDDPLERVSMDFGDERSEVEKQIKESITKRVVLAFLKSTDIGKIKKYLQKYRHQITAGDSFVGDVVNGNNPLILVQALLETGIDINTQDSKGTLLHHAIDAGKIEIVNFLLSQPDVDVNAIEKYHDLTPLHFAVAMQNEKIVEALLEKGAKVDEKDKYGDTPLHIAISNNGNSVIVEALLEKGAKVEAKNGHGHTPLYVAAMNGYEEIVKVLLAYKADVSAIPEDVRTTLSPEIIRLLTPPSCGVCNSST